MILALFETITTADVAVVTGKPDLFKINRWAIRINVEQSWLKLQPPLMDGHGMPDVPCGWVCNDLVGFAEKRNFKLTHTVDTVEEAKKVDSNIWPAKGLVEVQHVIL